MSEKLNEAVKAVYESIEDGVVGAYKKVKGAAVNAYEKTEDFFVDKLFCREGESVEEARERLKDHK